jgi:hypothetical protein
MRADASSTFDETSPVEAVRCGLGLGELLPANALETLERAYIFARLVLENTVEQLPLSFSLFL